MELQEFEMQLDIIKKHGFNPIGVSYYACEDVFIFKTKKEAKDAYNKLEMDSNGEWIGKVVGWWYEKDAFIKTFEEEKAKGFINREIKIIWL